MESIITKAPSTNEILDMWYHVTITRLTQYSPNLGCWLNPSQKYG